MKPRDLVRTAENLLGKPVDDPGLAERAAALLARQAVEETVGAHLSRFHVDTQEANFTAQLICLQGTMADKNLAREAAAIWGTLSNVLHVDGLELSPTESEVLEMVRRAGFVVEAFEARATPA